MDFLLFILEHNVLFVFPFTSTLLPFLHRVSIVSIQSSARLRLSVRQAVCVDSLKHTNTLESQNSQRNLKTGEDF